MGVKVPRGEASRRVAPDEVSILASAILDSASVTKAVQFVRPHALPDLDDSDIRRIIDSECFSVVGEVLSDREYKKHVKKRKAEVLENRRTSLTAMRNLLKDLETDLDHCLSTQQKYKIDLRGEAQALGSAVKALQNSIVAVAGLIQSEEEGRTRSAPNSDLFSAEYVRAVRRTWRRITGESPGVAKTLIVDFALELWEAVGLPDHGKQVPTRQWLEDRFKKIG